MPGSPPISTSEPRTTPPPSTRSSSPMPVGSRSRPRGHVPQRLRARRRRRAGAAPARRRLGALLHQRHVRAAGAQTIGARAGLRAREAALLTAVDDARAGSLALLGLGAVAAEALQQPAQQKTPLGARRGSRRGARTRSVGDEGADGALALVDLRGDLLEVGQRGLQIARGLADPRVGRLVLDEAAERALPPTRRSETSRKLCATTLQVLEHVLVLRVEQQRGHEPLVGGARLLGTCARACPSRPRSASRPRWTDRR